MSSSPSAFRARTAIGGLRLLAVMAVAALVVACAPRLATHGHVLTPETLAQIKPGSHSRAQITRLLGTPSSTATFDNETWYYIMRRTETVAFFAPRVIEQKVTAIRFDAQGRVSEVRHYGAADGRAIEMVDRKTPTRGREMGFIEQVFGNIGRGALPAPTR